MIDAGGGKASQLEKLTPMAKCIFILSSKSSGSSILQRRLTAITGASISAYTQHLQNETLFWTKAASVLGLPQDKLPNSEVPIPRNRARRSLAAFLERNLDKKVGLLNSRVEVFDAWTQLCQAFGPVFLEKSPHHLYQASVVRLMERYARENKRVGVHFIGLVRNPMSVLYSSWRRIGISPYREEIHWCRAYENLIELKERSPDLVSIVRYEDLVLGDQTLSNIFDFLGTKPGSLHEAEPFHSSSTEKWRKDPRFGFAPQRRTIDLATSYGYSKESMDNTNSKPWGTHRICHQIAWQIKNSIPKPIKSALKESIAIR